MGPRKPSRPLEAAAVTVKIATKYTHKTRIARLSGGGDSAYQPLSGASINSTTGLRSEPPHPGYRDAYEPGGYHVREGLAPPANGVLKKTTHRIYRPDTPWSWAFLLVVLFQGIICIALEGWIFAKFEYDLLGPAKHDSIGSNPAVSDIPTYLTIFIFGFMYQLALTWDALRLKNTIQIIGLCVYNLGMLIYSSVEISQLNDAVDALRYEGQITEDTWKYLHPALVATPCVIALGTVVLSGIAWKLYGEFAWTIYKHISADLRLKRRFLQYQIYIALLKFDFFFFLAFTVQFLVVAKGKVSLAEFIVTTVAIPVSIILLFSAAYFTRRESYIGQTAVIGVSFAAMAYFIFKLIRMYEPDQAHKYVPIRHSLTTFAVLAILLLIVTIFAAIMCLKNFNQGLKPHIQRQKVLSADEAAKYGGYGGAKYGGYGGSASTYTGAPPPDFNGSAHQLTQVPTRMTID